MVEVMSTAYIQRALFMTCQKHQHSLMVSNRYLDKWFEADFISVTKSDYLVEYEIKRSRADFMKEQEEKQVKLSWLNGVRSGELLTEDNRVVSEFTPWVEGQAYIKPGRYDMGRYKGPNRFWYCCPSGLLTVADMPTWAGLLWIDGGVSRKIGKVQVMKESPILHRTKLDSEQRQDILNRIQWAYWKLAFES